MSDQIALVRLADLQNVRKQRLEKLREKDLDTYKAVQWLEKNRDRFTGNVYEPILLELNVRDSRYASAIESVLGGINGPHLKVLHAYFHMVIGIKLLLTPSFMCGYHGILFSCSLANCSKTTSCSRAKSSTNKNSR